MLYSRMIQLGGFIFEVGSYSLLLKMRSIRSLLSFLMKHGFTYRDT
jgi:hypothetical protein